MNLKVVLAGCLFLLAGCQSMSYSDALGSGYAAVDALARTTEVAGAAGALIAQVVNAAWSKIGGIG